MRANPSEPIMSGIRAPPVSPKNTNGTPSRRAAPNSRFSLRPPAAAELARLTVMSSPAATTGRPSILPHPPILPSPGV